MAKEKEIGTVFSYFSKIGVAAVKVSGNMSIGDKIHIKGHTTDFTQKLVSMQVDNEEIEKAKKGDDVGIKVKDKVRPNDKIYKVE